MNDEYEDSSPPQAPSAQQMKDFVAAAGRGDEKEVRNFLDNYAFFINEPEGLREHTALTKAVAEGQTDMVELLLANGALVEAKGEMDRTPLLCAALEGNVETVRVLLENKAIIDAVYLDGVVPLTVAAWNGHTEVVRLFLERGAQIDVQTAIGLTPLMWASMGGHTGTAELLLEKSASLDKVSKSGQTALMLARNAGKTDTVEFLKKWSELQQLQGLERQEKERQLAEDIVKEQAAALLERLKKQRPQKPPFKKSGP
jgi:hypothetical protein